MSSVSDIEWEDTWLRKLWKSNKFLIVVLSFAFTAQLSIRYWTAIHLSMLALIEILLFIIIVVLCLCIRSWKAKIILLILYFSILKIDVNYGLNALAKRNFISSLDTKYSKTLKTVLKNYDLTDAYIQNKKLKIFYRNDNDYISEADSTDILNMMQEFNIQEFHKQGDIILLAIDVIIDNGSGFIYLGNGIRPEDLEDMRLFDYNIGIGQRVYGNWYRVSLT